MTHNVFDTVLHKKGLLCRTDNYHSNSDCTALRTMTGLKGESAIMLFVVFLQLLKLCGAIHNFACCPKALPFGCWFIVSQGVADGLAYARL
jgi:hypothetical protein